MNDPASDLIISPYQGHTQTTADGLTWCVRCGYFPGYGRDSLVCVDPSAERVAMPITLGQALYVHPDDVATISPREPGERFPALPLRALVVTRQAREFVVAMSPRQVHGLLAWAKGKADK